MDKLKFNEESFKQVVLQNLEFGKQRNKDLKEILTLENENRSLRTKLLKCQSELLIEARPKHLHVSFRREANHG